jgi:hypothetical protein
MKGMRPISTCSISDHSCGLRVCLVAGRTLSSVVIYDMGTIAPNNLSAEPWHPEYSETHFFLFSLYSFVSACYLLACSPSDAIKSVVDLRAGAGVQLKPLVTEYYWFADEPPCAKP